MKSRIFLLALVTFWVSGHSYAQNDGNGYSHGFKQVELSEELNNKLDKIIAVEEQLMAANFSMVGFEGKESLSKIKEKRDAGTLTEEEAEAYVAKVVQIFEAAVIKVMERDNDYDGDWSYESIRDHLIGPEELSSEELEEESCLAPYPRVGGRREGETIVTEAGS